MRKQLEVLAVLAITVPFMFVAEASSAAAPQGHTAVFLTPHQDDETTSMGAAISNAARAGTHVVVVLLTDGSESGVCYQRYGNGEPVQQQRDAGGLSRPARTLCTDQRDAEFKAAVTRLGADYLVRSDRKQDGCTDVDVARVVTSCTAADTLTTSYVRKVVDGLVTEYGANTSFNAMSYLEALHCSECGNGTTGPGSPDHATIGQGLLEAYRAGDVSHARFFIKPSLWVWWPGAGDGRPIGVWSHAVINAALRSYGADAPDGDGAGPSVAGDGIGAASTRDTCEQFDPRPGAHGTPQQQSPSLTCAGFDYFGDGPGAVFGGQDPNHPDIADGGADSYFHGPGVNARRAVLDRTDVVPTPTAAPAASDEPRW